MPSPKPIAGDVMVWGDNTCMVLGLTTRATGRKRPIPLALLDKTTPSGYRRILPKCTVAVASGVHSVAVSEDGHLWTWGVNDEGQLGRPIPEDDDEAPAVPGKVTIPGADPDAVVVGAATTDAATFALLSDGSVHGCGVFKDDHEIGFSRDNKHRQHGMARVDVPSPIAAVAAGNTHLVMLTDPAPSRGAGAGGKSSAKATVLTAGAGAQGQLGRVGPRVGPRRDADVLLGAAPVRLPRGAGRPIAVFAGGWHTFALTDADKVVAWGLNNWGQLGLPVGDGGARFVPTVVPELSGAGVVDIACGEHHTVALTSRGEVFTFGRAAYGRLGRPAGVPLEMGDAAAATPARVSFPASAGKMASVAAGMKESAAVDERGTMFLWGSGSGNMQGRGDDEDDVRAPEAVPEKEAYAHWRPKTQTIRSVSIGAQHVMALATPGHDGEW